MISELDTIILVKDRPDEGLVKGDVGAVVFIHEDGKAFEVEFTTLAGDPSGVLTLPEDEIRPVSASDVPHVRVSELSCQAATLHGKWFCCHDSGGTSM